MGALLQAVAYDGVLGLLRERCHHVVVLILVHKQPFDGHADLARVVHCTLKRGRQRQRVVNTVRARMRSRVVCCTGSRVCTSAARGLRCQDACAAARVSTPWKLLAERGSVLVGLTKCGWFHD